MRLLMVVIPKGNPDFEDRYEHVTNWWLEVGDDSLVHREIGFDAAGHALVAAPLGNNHGIFTDLDGAPASLGDLVELGEFERLWAEFHRDWRDAYPVEVARLRGQWHVLLGGFVALIAATWILSLFTVLPRGTFVFVAFCGILLMLTQAALHLKCPRCGNPVDIARAHGFPSECDVCHLRYREGIK
jgi:predicted RNA-binding Zn-ribbon protein involved in translation (DUF1610 family)